jgi:hypothetical protein
VATVISGTGEVRMHLSQSNKRRRVLPERIARKEEPWLAVGDLLHLMLNIGLILAVHISTDSLTDYTLRYIH